MSSIWLTSDVHFRHKNILKFCPNTRLGADAEEMTEILIENWNRQVKPDDTVYLLGDVFFCGYTEAMKIAQRLSGKIHLVYGNHDKVIRKNPTLQAHFESVQDYLRVHIGNQMVVMHHYPYLEWDQCHRGSYALFGHVHGSMDNHPHASTYRTMDVGVDSRPRGVEPRDGKMTLWHWEHVDEILRDREILRHHNVE